MERDCSAQTISIPQEAFIDSILARFNLVDAPTISTPLAPGTQFSAADCPTEEDEEMGTRPYRERSPPARSPVLGTAPAVFIGKQPTAPYGTSRVPRRGASSWVARPRRSSPSRMPTQRDDRRSIGAYIVKIGDGAVSWKSKRQTCVALSSTEAECMALCQASKEAVWPIFKCSLAIVVSCTWLVTLVILLSIMVKVSWLWGVVL